MKGCFIPIRSILDRINYGSVGGMIPTNVGISWDPNGNNQSVTHSWLDQLTSGQRYNDVDHMKVSAPVSYALAYTNFVPRSTWDTGVFSSYGYRRYKVTQCSYNYFEVITYYASRADQPLKPFERIYGHVVSSAQYHCYVEMVQLHRVNDWGVQKFTPEQRDVARKYELPELKEFYELLFSEHQTTVLEQDKFDIFSPVVLSLKSDVNNLENIGSLVDIVRMILSPKRAIMDGLHTINDFLKSGFTKKASKAWLAYRYQYATTMSDLQSTLEYYATERDLILDEVFRIGRSRTLRAAGSIGTCQYSCQFQLTPHRYYSRSYTCNLLANHFDMFYVQLQELGLNPSLKNLWDLVPLSFVMDWVIPIGDHFEAIDNERYLDAFSIINFGESFKDSVTVSWHGIPVTITRYYRHETTPPRGEFISSDPETGTSIRRIIDGVSLLISN